MRLKLYSLPAITFKNYRKAPVHFDILEIYRNYVNCALRKLSSLVKQQQPWRSFHKISTYQLWKNLKTFIGWPPKIRNSRLFRTLLWSTVIFFTLLDSTSFPHYSNTKVIKFGWKLFILWVISYGLSFSGFAINCSLVGGPPPTNGTVNFIGLSSDEQLFFSPYWIEHPFLIIMTPRSSNLIDNFLFYE